MSERPPVVVRRAGPADLAVAGAVTVAAYAEFTDGPEDGYIALLRDAGRRFREAELWVAELDGRVVGTVTLALPGSPWREIGAADEGEFRMLAVAPDARRRGVGDALTALVVDRFRDLGFRGVALSSLASMSAAHRLYQRHGFSRTPERDWRPHDGVHLIAYTREL